MSATTTPSQKEYVIVQKPQRWLIAGLSLISILSTSALGVLLWMGYHTPDVSPEYDLQFSEQVIQNEAARLQAQAGRDTTVQGNPCYGQSLYCPFWHYRNSAVLRIKALDQLEGR